MRGLFFSPLKITQFMIKKMCTYNFFKMLVFTYIFYNLLSSAISQCGKACARQKVHIYIYFHQKDATVFYLHYLGSENNENNNKGRLEK